MFRSMKLLLHEAGRCLFLQVVITFAEILKKKNPHWHNVLPEFSKETIHGHSPTFVPDMLSKGSVIEDSMLLAFCTKQF